MLIGLIFGLIVGWIISLFVEMLYLFKGFRVNGKANQLQGYYTIFALLGLIGGIIKIENEERINNHLLKFDGSCHNKAQLSVTHILG